MGGAWDKLKRVGSYVRMGWRSSDRDSYFQYKRGRERERKRAERGHENAERSAEHEREDAQREREYSKRYTAERTAEEPQTEPLGMARANPNERLGLRGAEGLTRPDADLPARRYHSTEPTSGRGGTLLSTARPSKEDSWIPGSG
jgi:hypothetical protein